MADDNHEAPDAGSAPTARTTTRRSQARGSSSGSGAKTINFVMQGKGGCGKTVAAQLVAEFLRCRGDAFACIDADPVNASFAAIRAFGAEHVRLVVGGKVNVDALNSLAERLYTEDACFVVDTGASSYLPLLSYLIDAEILDFLIDGGKRVLVHMPITGGRTLVHTVGSVERAAMELPERVELVPWFNPYFGPIVAEDGADLEKTVIYSEMAARLSGPVKIPDLNPAYAGSCFAAMLDANRTFAEERERVGLIQRMWLDRTWQAINDQVAGVV